MERFQAYVDANRNRFLRELGALCAQPSVAATGTGLAETAALVESKLRGLGAKVESYVIDGSAPVLCAELGAGTRTLMVYNHYDVQPAEPLGAWESPPFELTERDGRLYGRGVADDKGDLMCRLQAIEAYQAASGPLPLRLRFIIEGEEEIGSPNLDEFARRHPELLAADGCLWETGAKDASRRFVLELGVKGLCYVELSVTTADTDLHSMWGGVIPNAAWRLVWALASLKDADDSILIGGFQDHVRPPTTLELEHLAAIPFDEEELKSSFGFRRYVRDLTGLELLVRHFYEPTCSICGLNSGYQDRGVKTILPGTATAKLGFRLVPDLTPSLVLELLRAHLDRAGFGDVEVTLLGGIMPARSALDSPFVTACAAAAEKVYGAKPVLYPTSPGSGPLYALCRETPAVMAGVAHANSRLHAPNENIYVDDYFQGIRFVGELISCFSQK